MPPRNAAVAAASEDDESGYEFRLFTKSPGESAKSTTATRVIVRSPTPIDGQPGFTRPRRPDSYYFTGSIDDKLIKQYRNSAVTGEDIVKGLSDQWV